RNVDEMLRMVDALDFHTENGEVCPAGWNKGDEGIKENADGIAEYLSKNVSNL
ncbi:peroxiredoxin, partial [Candidatus Pseudothioglobus singularis]|nr:peroxiredoxin [Candidatus Pseudothioglobus singularis]